MSRVTIEQLGEFFRREARGGITGEAFQEFLDKAAKMGFKSLFAKMIKAARKAASECSDTHFRSCAFAEIAKALAQAKDFEAARKAASECSDTHLRSCAFAEIAKITGEAKDFEAARKAASECSDTYRRSCAFAEIAKALAQAM